MANNINWGKIYGSTWWGNVSNSISWGKSYISLLSNIADAFKTRVLGLGGIVESEECIEESIDASFYLKPSGYSDGKVYTALPEDGSGDMDFSRASGGTRINAQGEIENVNTLGNELITNSGFDTDSDWTKESNWTISEGISSKSSGVGGSLYQNKDNVTQGATYRLTFTALNVTSGNLYPFISGTQSSIIVSSDGFYSVDVVAGTNSDYEVNFYADNAFNGSIDNVSVKEVIEEGIPRLDYTDGGCPSLLLEPQSTNLYLNSNTLVTQDVVTSANNYTVSFYGTGSITFSGSFVGSLVGTGLNNRVSLTFTATSGTLTSNVSGVVENSQLEALPYATSYIPTSDGIATRVAETLERDNISHLINSEEGVLYLEMKALANDGISRTIALNNDTNNRIQLYFDTSNDSLSLFYKGQGTTAFIMQQNLIDATSLNKVAFKWKENDFALWVNGVESDTRSIGVSPVGLSSLDFKMFNDSSPFYGKVKDIRIYKTALTDQELTDLTTI